MALTKTKKAELLTGLEDIANAKTITFVKFDKLTVTDAMALRRELRQEGVSYRVVKKTLLKRALDSKQLAGTLPELAGEIAIAWSDDLLAPARGVFNFQKTHKEQVAIVGGVFDGGYKTQVEMLAIATIPPREVLLAQIANLLNSGVQRFAIALNEVAKTKTA
jgi:large subunit ribosomal protein L10